MEFKWLDDFLVLARTKNFSKAAEERHVTQSAFSRRIQALELWIGSPLIDRSTYPTTLTQEGRIFREKAEEIVNLLHYARMELRHKTETKKHTLSFAALHTLALTFYPRWIKLLETKVGEINTKILPDNFHNCVQALVEGGYDFLLTFTHPLVPITLDPKEYKSIVVSKDRLVAVGTPALINTHTSKSNPMPLLGYSRDSFLGRLASVAQEQEGTLPVRIVHTSENAMAEALKFMAIEGLGIAWMPHSLIVEELDAGKLVTVGRDLPMEIKLYRKAEKARTAIETFWDAAEKLNKN